MGDSAGTLVEPEGHRGVRLNPSVTPWMFTRRTDNAGSPVRISMESFDKTSLGEFVGSGAEENANRLRAMLRLCDGIGTDVLHRLHGKLSEILDTPRFPAARTWLHEGGPCMPPKVAAQMEATNERDARG